jgi:hypothetical protein
MQRKDDIQLLSNLSTTLLVSIILVSIDYFILVLTWFMVRILLVTMRLFMPTRTSMMETSQIRQKYLNLLLVQLSDQ